MVRPQHVADPADAEQVAVGRAQLDLRQGLALQQIDGRVLAAHDQQVALHRQGLVRVRQQPAHRLRRQALDLVGAQGVTAVAGKQVLHRQQVGRMLLHQTPAPPQQVAHRAIFLGVDVALGQQPQAQQLRQPAGVGVVVAVLEPAVLHDGGRVGQVDPVAGLHQGVDQPVPVVGGLHHQAHDGLAVGRQGRQHARPPRWPGACGSTTRSSSSNRATTLLFECRSIPP